MRGCFDIAALSRVLRKVALSRPASVATGDLRAPGRRSKLSIRRCRVLPVPTLSSRSFSLFYSFGIIGSRVGREDSPSPTGLRFTASFCERISAVTGSFPFWGLVLLSLEKDVRESTPIRGNISPGSDQTRFLPPFDRYLPPRSPGPFAHRVKGVKNERSDPLTHASIMGRAGEANGGGVFRPEGLSPHGPKCGDKPCWRCACPPRSQGPSPLRSALRIVTASAVW